MKALTISQPFASFIASGEKWIENRTWPTKYRGNLAIHAGKGKQYRDSYDLSEYPTGCLIAIAKLVGCETVDRILEKGASNERKQLISGTNKTWSEAARHKYMEGPWCWIFEDVRPITHVKMLGSLGLWETGEISIR